MKLENNSNNSSSAARFSEQISKVIELFQAWNDCERSVSLYAVLKRIPFSCTKFLQSVIDTNLTQAYCLEQTKLLEHNANSGTFIRSLGDAYKNLTCCANEMQLNKDSIFFESDRYGVGGGGVGLGGGGGGGVVGLAGGASVGGSGSLNDIADKYYKKEDILNDILKLIPILTPGNDEAKCAYLEFIPMTAEDAIRGTVNSTLVQQIFSYLLIHPAFTTNDRRSVNKCLRHFQDHIGSSDPNFIIYSGSSPTTSEPANSTTASSTNWQAIAPPQSKSTETIISWDSQHHLTATGGGGTSQSSYVDDVHEYRKSLGSLIEFKSAPGSCPKLGHLYESSGTDDHHISFSKNGTEIDFDCDDANNKSNTQIQMGYDTLANLNEFLTVPGVIDNITLKTRRSNSLTTTGTLQTATPCCTSSSVHNLNNLVQKPRSFSLSMVSPRSSLTSCGSDTRLDDFVPNYAKFTPHNVGMAGIGQWLKSLRLHKYVWLFSNITYDQMLDISEEYLQNLNVTKGARNKLVVCIQKLKDRHSVLVQLEKDLLTSQVQLVLALEELTSVVLTPMKPVEHFNKFDVGGQFLKVLNLVSTMMTTKHILPQDEEPVNSLLWILEKAVHKEAFVAHTNQLKEYRFKVSRIKIQFPPKSHYGSKSGPAASTSSGGLTRSRTPPGDSDYQSMSSKSNSTESLSSLVSPLLFPVDDIDDGYQFNRAVGPTSNTANEWSTPEPDTPTLISASPHNQWSTPWSITHDRFEAITLSDVQAPPADALPKRQFLFRANRPQLQDFINIPKLTETYASKSIVDSETANAVSDAAKISDFIVSNKTSVVDLTSNRCSGNQNMLTTSDAVPCYGISRPNMPQVFFAPSPQSVWLPEEPDVKPQNNHNKSIDLMTFPETTDSLDEAPAPDPPKPAIVSCIEFAKLNFGSSMVDIFKPDQTEAKLNDAKIPNVQNAIKAGLSMPGTRLTNPTQATRSAAFRSASSISSRICISSGIGSTCGSSIGVRSSAANSWPNVKPYVEQAKKPLYTDVVIRNRGMSDVPVWLKSLRLHKYTWVFVDMPYERMLAITEEHLEQLNITKGARNKLALSIVKLNERYHTMDCIEKGLLNGTCVTAMALDELSAVVQTPMKPVNSLDPYDVAGKFLHVVNLVYDRITGPALVRPEEQAINKFVWILEKAMYSEGCSAQTTHLRRLRMNFGDRKNVR